MIQDFTHPDTVEKVNKETQPFSETDKPWIGSLFPPETRRCSNLIGRSKTAIKEWLVDPLIRRLNAEFIDKTTHNYYGETRHTYTSEASCAISVSFSIDPEELLRDCFATTKTGMRLISIRPRQVIRKVQTHLWSSELVPRPGDDVVYAEHDVGEVWVMLGGVYHADGANTTSDKWRVVHGLFFTRGSMRQEEDVYLANTAEEVLSWSPEAQKIAGCSISSQNVIFVNFLSPIQYFLTGGVVDHYGDLDAADVK
ncbi:hypothetical protein M436DRAFT_86216 [Aureobasidium namibiae CBS 147.97]|uniref:Phytanoyl-CoA dioxygenase family protein n=1 Tax=Aureobasidium namibiae CBS 147.97 TaxID=1043004 RepID=A0A074X222_9PEZI